MFRINVYIKKILTRIWLFNKFLKAIKTVILGSNGFYQMDSYISERKSQNSHMSISLNVATKVISVITDSLIH